MTAPSGTQSLAASLLLRARAVGFCAQLFAEDTGPEEAAASLLEVLSLMGETIDGAPVIFSAGFRKPMLNGEVPAYETSYGPAPGAAGGQTFQMADIAGFYHAFGFEVRGQRPDHIAPELEFVALTLAKEAYARLSGEAEGGEICAEAREKFLAEHLCRWLPLIAERAESGGHEDLAAAARLVNRVLVV